MEAQPEQKSANQQGDDLTPRKLIYDNYFFESERMSHRTDWFLIFHSILLEAFFSINKCDTSSILTVGSLGVLLSIVWLANGLRYHRVQWQLGRFMEDSKMGDIGEMHKRVFAVRGSINDNRWFGWAAFVPLFGIVIPFIFIVCWVVLVCFRIPIGFFGLLLATVITVLVLILIAQVSRRLDRKFKKPSKKQ
jgi:hypothetical protein